MVVATRKRKYPEGGLPDPSDHASPGVRPPHPTTRHSRRLAKKPKQDYNPPGTSLPTPPASICGDEPPEAATPVPEAVKKPTTRSKPKPKSNPTPNPASTTLKRGRKWEIFFGREIKDDSAGVTDELLSDFLETEVTARFPQGSTYTGATGQWSRTLDDGSTVVVNEGTTIVFLVEFEGDDLRKLQGFRDLVADAARAYKTRFDQDAVLVCEIECLMDFI